MDTDELCMEAHAKDVRWHEEAGIRTAANLTG